MACNWIVNSCDCPVRCYVLQDCSGTLPSINVVPPDKPAPVGFVLIYAEYPGTCWEIISTGFCPDALDIQPVSSYENCECCIPEPAPVPDPVVRYPYIVNKIFSRITVGECDIKANQIFAESIYDQVKRLKYGIQTACVINQEQAWVRKEISDLASIYNPDLCVITVPNPCCVEPECEYPTPTGCGRATDITTNSSFDCDYPDLISVNETFG
jgi:hypothetical protein